MIVGECGVSPKYFLDNMSFSEVEYFLSGYNKRNRDSWEQTRTLCYLIAQVNSTKELKPTDILHFSWDEKTHAPTVTEEDKERLKNMAKEIEKLYKNG